MLEPACMRVTRRAAINEDGQNNTNNTEIDGLKSRIKIPAPKRVHDHCNLNMNQQTNERINTK